MKQFLFLLFVLNVIFTFGQTQFSIHLDSDVKIDSVSVSNFNNKITVPFDNGVAIVEMPAKASDQYSIHVANKRIDGWFNQGKIAVYLHYKNEALSVFKTRNTPIYHKQAAYFEKYLKFREDASIGTEFIKEAILENDQDTFVLVPLNSYLKLFQNDKTVLKFIEAFLSKQPKSTREHFIYPLITKRLGVLKAAKKIDMNTYSFINLKGQSSLIERDSNKKYMVLDFWFTNCPPCVKDHETILLNPNIFKGLSAELIGVSIDTEQEKWLSYLDKKNVPWKNYRDEVKTLVNELGVWSFPTYIILDMNNSILGSYSNIADTVSALKRMQS